MTEELPTAIARQAAAQAATEQEELLRLRTLSMDERSRLLETVCVAAAELEASRRAMGLPPSQPEPWPASTWEFLRKHAARYA